MSTAPVKVALVTGAARRIGRAIALGLAETGWHVGVHHRASAAAAQAVVNEIEAMGGKAVALQADLAISGEVEHLLATCRSRLGAPLCLVNNASLFLFDEVLSLTPAQWDAHQDINLKAPVLLAKAFAKALPEGATGNIINIIDQRVWRPTPLYFSYAVSKAGLFEATRMLAQALAPRIRVNAIGPGPVLQSIHQTPEQFARQVAATPLGLGPAPGEIAAAVRFILDAPALTGQMIVLDGGQHLAWRTPDVIGTGIAPASGPPVAVQQPTTLRPRAYADATVRTRHVFVRDLEIMTVIGVHDYEKRAPQRIIVNVDLAVREAGPVHSDRLEDVLDYAEVVRRVEQICQQGHVNLVETMAERVADACLAVPSVAAARVRIEKPDVVENAGSVGIEIERLRAPGWK